MPAKTITTSVNISSLDFHSEFDVPNQVLRVDLTPSVWLGTGYNNVLGAKFTITKLSGNMSLPLPNPTSNTYDIIPPDMQDGVVEFPLPLAFQGIEFGIYQLSVTLTDANSTTYTLSKNFDLCRPKQIGKDVNTDNASMNLLLDIKVRDGLGTAYDNTVYFYKMEPAVNKIYDNAIYFDSVLQIPPILSESQPPIAFGLYTGKTTYSASNIVTYDLDDEFSVIIKYSGSVNKEVPTVDFCKVYCCFTDILHKAAQYSGTNEGLLQSRKAEQVALYITAIWMGSDCGNDITEWIDAIQTVGGCDCSCDCAGAITPAPFSSGSGNTINIIGAGGITVSPPVTSGNTTTFIITGSDRTYSVVYGGTLNPPEIIITSSTSGSLTTTKLSLDLAVLQAYFVAGAITDTYPYIGFVPDVHVYLYDIGDTLAFNGEDVWILIDGTYELVGQPIDGAGLLALLNDLDLGVWALENGNYTVTGNHLYGEIFDSSLFVAEA